jgi:uncharacterized protein
MKALFLSFTCLLFLTSLSFSQNDTIPELHQRVTDFTNTLNYEQWRSLESQIKAFEDTTSTQIAVLIVPSLQGDDIRDFGIKVAEKNKIGRKGKDNGILLLVAMDEHQVSIEVGYGLEGVLPDAICDMIIRNEIRPRFRENDYYGGIEAGVSDIILATKNEYKAAKSNGIPVESYGTLLLFAVMFFTFIFSFFSGGRRYGISSRGHNSWIYWGGGFGGGMFGGGGSGFGGGGGWSGGGGSFGGGGASGGW